MIACENVEFRYPGDSFSLRIPACSIESGESVALVGPSGCGKTTFLNLLAGILVPASGAIRIGGQAVSTLGYEDRQRFRRENIGLVPQNFELLDYLTLKENLVVPARIGTGECSTESAVERANVLARRAGIGARLDHYPDQLSQGERQRAALCRGLVLEPRLLLADEPTGNLDPENQERIVDLLLEESRLIDATVVMITHEPELRPRFDRVIDMLELREAAPK